MRIYVASRNSGPFWSGTDSIRVLYIGDILLEAVESIGDASRFEVPIQTDWKPHLTAVPLKTPNVNPIRLYSADGWWWSVVAIDFNV